MKNKTPLFLLISGVIVYAVLVLFIWGERYFYDDELINLDLVSKFDYAGLINFLSTFDFHPPGQYLINNFFYNLFGADEWLMSIPSIICTGLSTGIAGLIVYRVTGSSVAGFISILFSSISSLLLMWGWSIRWYPYWTFITFLSFYFLIDLWREQKINFIKSIIIVLLFTTGLYINYLSLLFFLAVILTSLAVDFRRKNLSLNSLIGSTVYKTGIMIFTAVILFSPWLFNFSSQMRSYLGQKEMYDMVFNSNPFIVAGYSIFNGIFGSSIYPWNFSFIILFAGLFISVIIASYFFHNNRNEKGLTKKGITSFWTTILFTISFFIIIIIWSAFTQVIRSYILTLLHLMISVVLTASVYKLWGGIKSAGISKKLKFGYSYYLLAIIFFAGIWVTSFINVINKNHFHKMGLSDPVESVIQEIRKNINESTDKPITVMTISPVLSYYLNKIDNNNSFLITPSDYYRTPPDNKELSQSEIIFVETYLGSYLPFAERYFEIKNYIESKGNLLGKPVYLGRDNDYQMKRKIASAYLLPEYRFIINKYKPYSTWDSEKILLLRKLKTF